jgi:hypothetical protein
MAAGEFHMLSLDHLEYNNIDLHAAPWFSRVQEMLVHIKV